MAPPSVKAHPGIFPFLSRRDKFARLCDTYRTTAQPEALDQIVGLLNSDGELISGAPAEIKEHPRIFPFLPAAEKLSKCIDAYRRTGQPETLDLMLRILGSNSHLITMIPAKLSFLKSFLIYLLVKNLAGTLRRIVEPEKQKLLNSLPG